jgi:hypothetical protein
MYYKCVKEILLLKAGIGFLTGYTINIEIRNLLYRSDLPNQQ